MSDVFISYASEDRESILPLVEHLQRQGWSVWWDRKIPPGKNFDEVIEDAIEVARCVVVVWSKSSIISRWVKTEASEGDRRGILVPVQIDSASIPLEFRRLQAAQLQDWNGNTADTEVRKVVDAVSALLDSRLRQDSPTVAQAPYVSGIRDKSLPHKWGSPLTIHTLRILLLVGLLGIAATTIVVGWIKERDIWYLVPSFWFPILVAIPIVYSFIFSRGK